MAESPPQGGLPPSGGLEGADGDEAKRGESDPLFNPPNMKTRKTVMGLAPAPHLGGANPAERETAEARKQRVLARIAALDANARGKGPLPPRPMSQPPGAGSVPPGAIGSVVPSPMVSVGPSSFAPPPGGAKQSTAPPPAKVEPAPGRPPAASSVAPPATSPTPPPAPGSGPPPPARAPSSDAPPRAALPASEKTQIVPPAAREPQKLLSGTLLMTPGVPLTLPKGHPSESKVPSAPPATSAGADLVAPGPTTQRMLRPATPADPIAPAATTTALAIRPWEPPRPTHPQPAPRPAPVDARLILVNEPHSARAASFRLLRDSLIAKSMPRVVAVTSAAIKDGKTTCASNLALALAEQQGTRVLLLDGNFFEPELAEIFHVARLPPVAPPAASAWLAPYKIVEARPTLHVAGIVRTPGDPPPRFDQPRYEALIDRLVRVAYDYIIVDAPALRGSAAVVQLLASSDGTLLAVRSGGTTTRDLRRAVDQIPKNKALGIALVDAG